jgi:hypothetical protein
MPDFADTDQNKLQQQALLFYTNRLKIQEIIVNILSLKRLPSESRRRGGIFKYERMKDGSERISFGTMRMCFYALLTMLQHLHDNTKYFRLPVVVVEGFNPLNHEIGKFKLL